MGFQTFRATKDISLGQLRRVLRAGDLVEFDGTTTRVDGREYRVPVMDAVIANKWLVPNVPMEEAALILSAPAQLPVAPTPTAALVPPEERNVQGERIPFASPEAKAANGKRAKANTPHVWIADDFGSPNRLCCVCGVTERRDLIRADRKRGDGTQQIHYVDAHGNAIVALEEFGCPVYLGDPGSAAAYAKDQVRKVRDRVDGVEEHIESVEERLARVEADNEFFRQRLLERPTLDAEMVAEALLIIAARGGQAPALTERVQALLPPAMDATDLLRPVFEAEPVMAEVYHPEGTDDPRSRE